MADAKLIVSERFGGSMFSKTIWAIAAAHLLTACASSSALDADIATRMATSSLGFVAEQGVSFESAWEQVGPIAKDLCIQSHPNRGNNYCNFSLTVGSSAVSGANAQLMIGDDGRPEIHIGRGMVRSQIGHHEMTFILAHEASHQIADHLANTLHFGSVSEGHFSLVAPNQQAMEMEADVIATIILSRVGLDPWRGAQAISKFAAHLDGTSATHPDSTRRLAVVKATMSALQAGEEILWN